MDMGRVRVASCLICCIVLMVIKYHQYIDAKCHASLLSSLLLENSLYLGVNGNPKWSHMGEVEMEHSRQGYGKMAIGVMSNLKVHCE